MNKKMRIPKKHSVTFLMKRLILQRTLMLLIFKTQIRSSLIGLILIMKVVKKIQSSEKSREAARTVSVYRLCNMRGLLQQMGRLLRFTRMQNLITITRNKNSNSCHTYLSQLITKAKVFKPKISCYTTTNLIFCLLIARKIAEQSILTQKEGNSLKNITQMVNQESKVFHKQ